MLQPQDMGQQFLSTQCKPIKTLHGLGVISDVQVLRLSEIHSSKQINVSFNVCLGTAQMDFGQSDHTHEALK